jgi:aldose 1-epimerase
MPPRNNDLTLELDTLRLVINPLVGASIVSLHHRHPSGAWAPVLRDMPSDSTDPADAGSFLMLPWTNRVSKARFTFEDRTFALTPNHSDGTAIHGIGRDRAWTITDRSPITARLTLDTRDDPASPYPFGGIVRYEIGPDRVEIDLSVTNLGANPIPVGCGHHPYFHRHLHSDADQLRMRVGVTGRYVCDECIPSGEVVDDEICATLRAGGPVDNPGLDDVFAGFDGQAVLEWPASNVRLRMQCSDELGHVVVYTPINSDGTPDEFVCVEPVSMVNDGFNLMRRGTENTGVRVLNPGQTFRTRTSMLFEPMN